MDKNGSNSSCILYDPYLDDLKVVKVTVLIVLGFMGLVGNSLVLLLATKFIARKNINYLIANMSVADSLVVFAICVSALPEYWSYNVWTSSGLWNKVACKGMSFTQIAAVFTSFNTLMVISIERFKATKHTVQRQMPYSLKQRLFLWACCWFLPFSVASYAIPLYGIKKVSESVSCSILAHTKILFWIFLAQFCLSFSIFLVIIGLSVATLHNLSKSQPIDAHLSEAQRQIRILRTRKVVAMVLSSLALYVLCYFPYCITDMLFKIPSHFEKTYKILDFGCFNSIVENVFFVIFTILPLVNSCLSPCICLVFLADFRQGARRFFSRTRSQPINRINSEHANSLYGNSTSRTTEM